MKNLIVFFFAFTLLSLASCEKKSEIITEIVSNDAIEHRSELIDKGYTEIIVAPIVKESCYFEKWDKTVETPVSGLFEYRDQDNNWIASIDFGDGTCDEWAKKTWSVDIFPDYPEGESEFSVFDIKYKKK